MSIPTPTGAYPRSMCAAELSATADVVAALALELAAVVELVADVAP
jgi:hypothetical protein